MSRTKAISTSNYRIYKYSVFAFLTMLVLLVIVQNVRFKSSIGIMTAGLYIFLMVKYWFPSMKKSLRQMKNLSYDNENLYIVEKGVEEQVPFTEVRDVEIVSLDGIYKFNFFDSTLHEGAVTCKTSMWYPLNFKRVDAELDRVRSHVRKAHENLKQQIGNENRLASYNQ